MTDVNKPIWQLTIGEFVEILESKMPKSVSETNHEKKVDITYVYGLDGLAKLLGCSKNYAGRLKRTGMYDKAIKQKGRTIIVDAEMALTLFNGNKK